jgi:type III secretion protein V
MSSSGVTVKPSAAQRYADAALPLLLLLIIALMIIPVPTPLLDVLIAGNIAIGVLMLLVSMAIPDGLAFAAMPTVLLITTLYRLALNVSSTRLILLQADAGRVIASFGEFVVRGNYAVGAVVFLILTLIQYLVVARGSERVAEVGARFTLDAMPGKQMAIDADLRAGTLTPEGARERRRTLEREGQFYGAMDGAMKFVKGDAIAGIVIIVINLVAGVGIGVGMRDLDVMQSLRLYGLLTIGDGLVCQIPSLLISTSAGLVVTRVAAQDDGGSLGRDVGTQLFGNPRVLGLGAGFLALLAIVPGLPALPFGLLSILLAASSYGLAQAQRRARRELASRPATLEGPLRLEAGAELARELEAVLPELLDQVSARSRLELGLALPAPTCSARTDLAARAYVVCLNDVPVASGELPDATRSIEALVAQLTSVTRRHAAELCSMQEAQALLDELASSAPALVRAVVPKPVGLKLFTDVLRGLLAEGVSVRPLRPILDALANESAPGPSASVLIAHVRVALRAQISHAHARDGVIAAYAVDPAIEDALRDALPSKGAAHGLALPPDLAREIVQAVKDAVGAQPGAVLLIQPDVRAALRSLLRAELPEAAVLSYEELNPETRIERRGVVAVGRA